MQSDLTFVGSPDAHGIAVLLLIALALFLFTRDDLPLETSSLVILVTLVVGFQLFPYEGITGPLGASEFVSGFGHEALVAICSLLIIGRALEVTGALQPFARAVSRSWTGRPVLSLLMMLIAVAVMSGFINDTPIVALMIPLLLGMSLRAKTPVSKVMLPMGLATIIGGMATTIGTSTNLLVVSIAYDLGIPAIGMFDFLVPALIVGSVGMTYVWLVVPRLLPVRESPMDDATPRIFNAQLHIMPDSFADERPLSEILARTDGRMRVTRIKRTDSLELARLPTAVLRAGDRIFVSDFADNLKEFESLLGATLYNAADTEQPVDEQFPLAADDQQLAEIVVSPNSRLHRRTLAELSFGARFDVIPVAIHRPRAPRSKLAVDIEHSRLRAGDVVLVQGSRDALLAIRKRSDLLVLDGSTDLPPAQGGKRALGVLALVIGAAASGLVPISISALAGVGLLLVLRCVTWRDISSSLPVTIIMLIATSLALGKALVGTGMANWLASGFVGAAEDLPIPVVLSGFLLIMGILTNIVSNNAAAVIGTPIAIATATQLGADPLPFVIAVLFGANLSFVTPFGYQTNLLVMSAGGYRFSDFLKAGIPLALIMWIGFSLVLPWYYGLG